MILRAAVVSSAVAYQPCPPHPARAPRSNRPILNARPSPALDGGIFASVSVPYGSGGLSTRCIACHTLAVFRHLGQPPIVALARCPTMHVLLEFGVAAQPRCRSMLLLSPRIPEDSRQAQQGGRNARRIAIGYANRLQHRGGSESEQSST